VQLVGKGVHGIVDKLRMRVIHKALTSYP